MFTTISTYVPFDGTVFEEASMCVPSDTDLSLREIIDKYAHGKVDESLFREYDDTEEDFDTYIDPAMDIVDDKLSYADELRRSDILERKYKSLGPDDHSSDSEAEASKEEVAEEQEPSA